LAPRRSHPPALPMPAERAHNHPVRHAPPSTTPQTVCGVSKWWANPNYSTISTFPHTQPVGLYGTTSIGFTPPKWLRASPTVHGVPIVRSSLPALREETGRYRRFIGDTHERGTLLKSCPCGQRRDCVAEQSTLRQFHCRSSMHANKFASTNCLRSTFRFFCVCIFDFFTIQQFRICHFPLCALYNVRGPHCVAGDDPCERAPATRRRGERSVTRRRQTGSIRNTGMIAGPGQSPVLHDAGFPSVHDF
jgi:hypothetical protein